MSKGAVCRSQRFVEGIVLSKSSFGRRDRFVEVIVLSKSSFGRRDRFAERIVLSKASFGRRRCRFGLDSISCRTAVLPVLTALVSPRFRTEPHPSIPPSFKNSGNPFPPFFYPTCFLLLEYGNLFIRFRLDTCCV